MYMLKLGRQSQSTSHHDQLNQTGLGHVMNTTFFPFQLFHFAREENCLSELEFVSIVVLLMGSQEKMKPFLSLSGLDTYWLESQEIPGTCKVHTNHPCTK